MIENKNLKEERVRITMHSEEERLGNRPAVAAAEHETVSLPEHNSDPPEMKSGMREATGFDEGLDFEEDLEDEIDIVVEEDGQIIKISSEEMNKLRSEFEENRLIEEKEKEN